MPREREKEKYVGVGWEGGHVASPVMKMHNKLVYGRNECRTCAARSTRSD